ncbi:MAG: DUF5656 family protein [Chloroflexota bacterium]
MSNTQRLVLLVSLILIGLAFSLVIEPPAMWVLAAILIAITCVGTDHIIHLHWRVHIRRHRYAVTLWIVPALLVFGATLFLRLPVFSGGVAVVAGLVVTGVLLALVIVSEYRTLDPNDPLYGTARFVLNVVAYLSAFALYTAIYGTKVRSLVTATAITIVSALIALELLRGLEARVARNWLYAAVCGLVMGEITWALNYWILPGLVGGVFLLLAFYCVTGMMQNYLAGALTHRLAVEFGLVTGLGLAFVAGALLLQRPF